MNGEKLTKKEMEAVRVISKELEKYVASMDLKRVTQILASVYKEGSYLDLEVLEQEKAMLEEYFQKPMAI